MPNEWEHNNNKWQRFNEREVEEKNAIKWARE